MFLVMTFSYLGAFLDPVGNLRGMPVILVNEDRPAHALGSLVAAGEQAMAETRATPDARVRWITVRTRRKALAMLRANQAAGAIVFPAGLSQRIVQLGTAAATGNAPRRAEIDVFRNEGGGLFVSTVFDLVAERVRHDLSREVHRQVALQLERLGVRIAPADTPVVGDPISMTVTRVAALTNKAGRGLAPSTSRS